MKGFLEVTYRLPVDTEEIVPGLPHLDLMGNTPEAINSSLENTTWCFNNFDPHEMVQRLNENTGGKAHCACPWVTAKFVPDKPL